MGRSGTTLLWSSGVKGCAARVLLEARHANLVEARRVGSAGAVGLVEGIGGIAEFGLRLHCSER